MLLSSGVFTTYRVNPSCLDKAGRATSITGEKKQSNGQWNAFLASAVLLRESYRGISLIKKKTTPYHHNRNPDIVLLQGPRGGDVCFL